MRRDNGEQLLLNNLSVGTNEVGFFDIYQSVLSYYKRYSGSLENGKYGHGPSTSSLSFVSNQSLCLSSIDSIYTYHGIKYLVSGSIKGSAGGTVTIDLHDTSTNQRVLTTSRTGNGSYSFNWHDDINTIYVVARESDTLKGASRVGYAGSGSYDIGLFNTTREYLF